MRNFLDMLRGHVLPTESNAYRPHLLRKPWLLFFLTIVLTSEAVYVASVMSSKSAHSFLSAVLPGDVIALTNEERTQVGDKALVENETLAQAAQDKANDMAAKGYFSHVGPDGREPWTWITAAGYSYQYAGENLAVRFDDSADVVHAWMASPSHRENIVKPVYTEIGIGVAQGMYQGSPATFVVQYFGTPRTAIVAAAPSATKDVSTVPKTSTTAEVAGASIEKKNEVTVAPTTTVISAPTIEVRPIADAAQNASANMRESAQIFLRANEASQATVGWIMGGVASLLMILLALAFFVHIEIQPTDMLLGGAFVGAVAIALISFNGSFITISTGGQSASALQASSARHVVLTGLQATSTELLGG